MPIKNKRKQRGSTKIVFLVVVIAAIVAILFLLRFGIGENIAQNGGAMISGVWQNIFGSATYDIGPDDGTVVDEGNASRTAIADATSSTDSSSDAEESSSPAVIQKITKRTGKRAISSKKSSVSTPNNKKSGPREGKDNNTNKSSSSDAQHVSENLIPVTSTTQGSAPSSNLAQNNPQTLCAFPSVPSSPSRKIIVNEIAWMGSPSSTGRSATAASDDEWIELKNISSDDVALAGWSIVSGSSAIKIIFSSGDHISAGGLWLLARGTGGAVSLIAQKIYSGGLSNTGDELAVLDAQCNVSDFLNALAGWPGGNNTTKQTLERAADHVSWQTSAPVGGTPGAENSLGAASQPLPAPSQPQPTSTATSTSGSSGESPVGSGTSGSTGGNSSSTGDTGGTGSASSTASSSAQTILCPANHVVVAQIQIAGASSANDFVKLYNPTAAALDIGGWKLRKKSSGGTDASLKVLGKGSTIESNGYFVWANSANGFAVSLGADASSTETIAADNSVALMNASGTIVDEVAWGTGTNQYVEGSAFPTNPAANQILTRVSINGAVNDSDDNATDFALH